MGCGATRVRDETTAVDELKGPDSGQRHIPPVFAESGSQEIQTIQTLPLKPKETAATVFAPIVCTEKDQHHVDDSGFVRIVITEKDQHPVDDSGLDCQSSMNSSIVPVPCGVPLAPTGWTHRWYVRKLNRYVREEARAPTIPWQVDCKRKMLQIDLSEASNEELIGSE